MIIIGSFLGEVAYSLGSDWIISSNFWIKVLIGIVQNISSNFWRLCSLPYDLIYILMVFKATVSAIQFTYGPETSAKAVLCTASSQELWSVSYIVRYLPGNFTPSLPAAIAGWSSGFCGLLVTSSKRLGVSWMKCGSHDWFAGSYCKCSCTCKFSLKIWEVPLISHAQ